MPICATFFRSTVKHALQNTQNQSINQSSIVVKTIKLTPRPRMALNGATLQQQLAVHNTGAEQKTTNEK